MIVCLAENLSRHYDQEPVFSEISFRIETGDRIGLVGPNGAGKTTLLRVLAGIDAPDTGSVCFPSQMTTVMLEQFPDFPLQRPLCVEVREAMKHLQQWHTQMLLAGHRMAEATDEDERNRWMRKYDEFQELLRQHGGYEFDYRIDEVLAGLGFCRSEYDRPLGTFSGGQQSRVLLAKLLLRASDLMLLDEPTNHLDIDATEWLEDYLTRQQSALVLVSHDRYLLDRTCSKIFELHGGRLTNYPGNYRAYVKQRAERQKVADRVRTKQEDQITHHQEYIRRNRSGQLARQAKSREKMIERVQTGLVETIQEIRGPHMGFGTPSRTGDLVFIAREVGKSFERPLFEEVTLEIQRGQRIGIIGANGTGKTTLLRILLGEEPPSTGTLKRGHQVRIGYLDQELSCLAESDIPLDAVRPPWRVAEKVEPFRALLARFGIGADLVEQRIGSLSGGERARVALARLSAMDINVLALDEPTNHLDLWARESLEKALKEFTGTVLVVSHDRYFLNRVVDRLLLVADGRVKQILGNYDRYLEYKLQAADEQSADEANEKKTADAEFAVIRKKWKYPFRKTSEIEADITVRETKIAELKECVQESEIFKDGRKLHQIGQEVSQLEAELEELLEHWEEAMQRNPRP